MRYFSDRKSAGQLLANSLKDKHNGDECIVIGLSEGGVVVGIEIAKQLSCEIYLLVSEDIELPGEMDPIGAVSSSGMFTQNINAYPSGELEYINADYHTVIEQNRLQAFQKINRITSKDGSSIPKKHLKDRTVILVSDGLRNGLSLDVAADFLKPVKIKNLVIASPIAAVEVVDKMHLIADKIVCLGVVEEYINTDHYYQDNKMPEHETIILTMKNLMANKQDGDE